MSMFETDKFYRVENGDFDRRITYWFYLYILRYGGAATNLVRVVQNGAQNIKYSRH